jgi:DNA-binding NtrC family response regulator
MARILFIDDDTDFSPLLAEALGEHGHEARWLACAEEGLRLLQQGPRRWDVVLLDQYMPRMDGLELLAALRPQEACPPVLLFTGLDASDVAIRASKLGAFGYLPKPSGLERPQLAALLGKIGEAAESARPQATPARGGPAEEMLLGRSARMREVHRQVGLAASHDEPVLVVGEVGSGKKHAAEAAHRYSARAGRPLVTVNCLAFDEAGLSSRLFGHGADQAGAFEQADGGTVLLDHFHRLGLSAQARAAEVLRERVVYRNGPGAKPCPVRARLIACSSEGLRGALAEGRLYWGLYSLLEGATISMPSLRERGDDVLLLADHFLQQAAASSRRPAPALSVRARQLLLAHSWPGNVRELQGVMRQAVLACRGAEIGPEELPVEAAGAGTRGLPPSREKAYRLFCWAVAREPALANGSDAEVFRWLQRDQRVEHDDFPGSCATFCRYLREARLYYRSQKNSPRAGRPLGRSVVRVGEA